MAASHRRQSSDPFRDKGPNAVNYGSPSALPTSNEDDMLSAVRGSVTVKPVKSVTDPPRSKTGSSNNTSGTNSPPRTHRPESAAHGEREKRRKVKKPSMHADIIDRLDFSGVGAAMLHHDGPFDACAPSRNKHKHKAPMMAWGPGDTNNDPPANVTDFSTERRLSPLPQSTPSAMSLYDSPYGPASLYPDSPSSPGSIPKKRVDALAEAWGMAEPEPFEEFFAGGGDKSAGDSIKNGRDSHSSSSSRRAKDARDAYQDYHNDIPRTRSHRTRSTLPPPKPISLPGSRSMETDSTLDLSSSPEGGEPSPRRSRSLISRIRKMRDSPNVPVTYAEEFEPSESTADSPPDSLESSTTPSAPVRPLNRPTHKHQTSFLGRFTRSPDGGGGGATSEIGDNEAREKELPPPPSDYFGDGGRGLGRKTSLMKRFKGVRRGSKP